MHVRHFVRFILCCALSLAAGSAFAYVGPGAGISMLGSLWGLLVAIVFVVVGLLIFPIKVLRNRLRAKKQADGDDDSAERDPQ
jgi:hypothetical protein